MLKKLMFSLDLFEEDQVDFEKTEIKCQVFCVVKGNCIMIFRTCCILGNLYGVISTTVRNCMKISSDKMYL